MSPGFQNNIQKFQKQVETQYIQKSFNHHFNIWVMDETGVWDEAVSKRTYI